MSEKNSTIFLYATSPVHMGTDQAIGVIDNPIQRERHTGHPCFSGSGIKGAVRHAWQSLVGQASNKNEDEIDPVLLFGPESDSVNEHSGAVNFNDAQIVVLPVRSLKQGFVYATCPLALARAKRILKSSVSSLSWNIPSSLSEGECQLINNALLTADKLHLEAFEYSSTQGDSNILDTISGDLATYALPQDDEFVFFRDKLKRDLVILSDTDFSYFSRYAMLVEPHVRIDPNSGTAKKGGLFYSENLPPESLMIASLRTGDTRGGQQKKSSAEEVMNHLKDVLDNQLFQIGGDATTGRGLVMARVLSEGFSHANT